MNSREGRGIMIALGLAIAILISACGTLQIDTEPVVAEDEIAGSATELTQDVMEEVTGDVTDDGTAMPEEASTEVATVEDVIESPNKASEITDLDDTWNQFTDHRLGFSIEFPKEMVTFRGSCTWNEEESSFRPELAPVPVQIFEDTDAVYIAAEQYYELAGERRDGGRAYYDECNLVTNSLELLQDPDGFKEPYWELVVKDIHSDAELDSFIKERYGAGCSAGEQVSSTQDGVYDVKIQGDGKDLAESQCPMNYVTVVKYYPEGNKVVAWDRGQANSFVADVSYQVVYDQEMEDSFRFLTDGSPEAEDAEGPETAEQSNGGPTEEAGDETTAAAANYDYSDWLPYANETLGYSLMYPAQADIMGADRDKGVEFVGPVVGDDHWPWFTIHHFDSEFFRPPAGIDVRQWLADSDIPYKTGAQETTIGDLPAVHLRVEPSPQAYGMDEYYVINGDQLFKITILHAGGLEDWDLYDQFLASVTFGQANA